MIPVLAFGFGMWELLLLLLIVLVLFGAGRLPQVVDRVGSSIRTLRDTKEQDS